MILTIIISTLLIIVLIGFNALYVAGEFSTVSARKTRIRQQAEDGNRLARQLLPVLEDPHKLDNYIAASQVGITLSSITLGIYGQNQIAALLIPPLTKIPIAPLAQEATAAGVAAILVLTILTILQVVLGELVPKSLALRYPEQMALLTSVPMRLSADVILKPLIILLNGSGILVLKLLGVGHGGGHNHVHSPEEIIFLVKESYRGGILESGEGKLIRNVFRASETTAIEIAVPRTRIIAASSSSTVKEVLALCAKSAYTRIPVYEKDIDHIVGFVHLKGLFKLYRTNPDAGLEGVIRELSFFPETLLGFEIWERLNQDQSYIAIIVDEYGGTSGLLTREDLIEEFFGEVQDEFDQERAPIILLSDRKLRVRGDVQISYLNDLLEIDLPHETSHTIAGLLLDSLGRIPKEGDKVQAEEIKLYVETVVNRAAEIVIITIPSDFDIASLESLL